MNANKRPVTVLIIACMYIAVGMLGFGFGLVWNSMPLNMNPVVPPSVSVTTSSGSLGAGTYYTKIAYYTGSTLSN